jgi:hypothetical protein
MTRFDQMNQRYWSVATWGQHKLFGHDRFLPIHPNLPVGRQRVSIASALSAEALSMTFLLAASTTYYNQAADARVSASGALIQIGVNLMPRENDASHAKDRKKPPTQRDDEDLVITPAGPLPRDKVHPVGPGEGVRRNPDGSYSIIPRNDKNDRK